jgi:hypothetical protein
VENLASLFRFGANRNDFPSFTETNRDRNAFVSKLL